jgi:transcriptional regulator with XRE-family HTH domain
MADDPYSSPLAFFGGELKRLRERTGMTQTDVAKQTNYALSTVSAYERGTLIPSSAFAERADGIFGTDEYDEATKIHNGDLARLQKLVEQVSVRPWFRDRVEVERKATEIREYESYQIPGLLQTEDYAQAIVSSVRPVLADDAIERAVALRMTRQQILEPDDGVPIDQANGPRLWSIIDESALYRVVGSPDIMKAQCEHLVTMARRPNITIQIVPNTEGATCAFGRAFAVLVSRNNSAVVYFEDIGTARYVRDRDEVSRYNLIFDYLRSCALNDKQSIELIKGAVK